MTPSESIGKILNAFYQLIHQVFTHTRFQLSIQCNYLPEYTRDRVQRRAATIHAKDFNN